MNNNALVSGAGLGFRREMESDLDLITADKVDFLEVAPENWMRLGGKYQHLFEQVAASHNMLTHGLSLSLGSPDPLDIDFVKEVGQFLKKYKIKHYSEHLSYCSADGHMYDLMPIPFTEEAVHYVAARIRQVQDILEQKIAIENVSAYLSQSSELTELEFTNAILAEADCHLLLDVNNVYVNSINHKYDGKKFIDGLPSERILYGHIAGHYDEADDLKIDTHGSDVIQPVWQLLEHAYEQHGVFPTLLERDFNIPALDELFDEVNMIKKLQASVGNRSTKGLY
ncbi:UPF0276 protein [Psychrosphaera saromensis]|uniref:Uncharacterized protein n=1 Tax=Psychrosphaera saromensis TaxID=716813 RepID=A0A2S7UZ56_9GAMM|nr:DUF692 domain-containing protein [Psychrosphaera saromensis]PQJ55018.1 hypothetical protein BTO11_16045 [Psychrosphaera saromensis]GHB55313.1 UPF0276 protein [Psychrosphaera saromensis]